MSDLPVAVLASARKAKASGAQQTVGPVLTHGRRSRLLNALTLDVRSLIVLPIDYSIDVAISEELGTETVTA